MVTLSCCPPTFCNSLSTSLNDSSVLMANCLRVSVEEQAPSRLCSHVCVTWRSTICRRSGGSLCKYFSGSGRTGECLRLPAGQCNALASADSRGVQLVISGPEEKKTYANPLRPYCTERVAIEVSSSCSSSSCAHDGVMAQKHRNIQTNV